MRILLLCLLLGVFLSGAVLCCGIGDARADATSALQRPPLLFTDPSTKRPKLKRTASEPNPKPDGAAGTASESDYAAKTWLRVSRVVIDVAPAVSGTTPAWMPSAAIREEVERLWRGGHMDGGKDSLNVQPGFPVIAWGTRKDDREVMAVRMTVEQLFKLSEILKRVMNEHGHNFNLVVVPEQQVSDAFGQGPATDLHLTIVNATVRDVVVLPASANDAGSGRPGPAEAERCRLEGVHDFPLVERYLNQLKSEASLTTFALERQILLAEDIPGITVKAVLRPDCEAVGGTQLVAYVGAKDQEYQASLDNRASTFTGPMEATAAVRFRSVITQGDEIGLTAYNTLNKEQTFGLIDGSTAIGATGLRLRGSFGAGHSIPGDFLRYVGYDGTLLTADIGLTHPMIRSRRFSLFAEADLTYQNSRISVDDTRDPGHSTRQSSANTNVLRAGLQGSWFGEMLGARRDITFDLKAHRGLPFLDATDPGDVLSPRPGGQGVFSKLTGEVRGQFGLPPALLRLTGMDREFLDDEWLAISLDAGIRGQYTRDILLPAEKMYFGGSRYGRGYYSGEVTGDRGFIADLELDITRKNLLLSFDPIIRADTTLYGFYNQGFAYDVDPDHPPRRRVESAGGGLRFDFEGRLRMEVEYVRRAQRRPGGAGTDLLDRNAVYWRVGSQF